MHLLTTKIIFVLVNILICSQLLSAASPPTQRARDLGIPFEGTPGPLNAITDIKGISVGHETVIKDFANEVAARTGVTAILPRGKVTNENPVFAAYFSLNGNGEMTGTHWVDESGFLEGPIMITNTHSVGVVHDAVIAYRVAAGGADTSGYWWSLPVVAETWDGYLNDINGFHVTAAHAKRALENAKGGPVAEGNVGGGTGMICHEFKCGIGTSSRITKTDDGNFTVAALVQANYGMRDTLRIAGVPVGQFLRDNRVYSEDDPHAAETGSIIIVVATDAPLLPHQLKRLAKRAAMGLARNGSYAGNGSGDVFIAFSTANAAAQQSGPAVSLKMISNDAMDPFFLATVQATEEAIINAMVAAKDMQGHQGTMVNAIPHDKLRKVLAEHNRLMK